MAQDTAQWRISVDKVMTFQVPWRRISSPKQPSPSREGLFSMEIETGCEDTNRTQLAQNGVQTGRHCEEVIKYFAPLKQLRDCQLLEKDSA